MSNTLNRTSKEYIKTIFDVITRNKLKSNNYETELESLGYVYTVDATLLNIIRLAFESIKPLSDDTIESYQNKIFTSLQANGDKLKAQLKEPTFDCVFDLVPVLSWQILYPFLFHSRYKLSRFEYRL